MDLNQPYDSSLKVLFEGHAAEITHHLLKVDHVDELGTEVLKPPLRADRVYLMLYEGMLGILHAELETASDSEMDYRMLEYYGSLLRKHRKPILPVVIYPFRTALPKSPLLIVLGNRKILEFHFDIVAMWKESAKYYLDNHVMGMYPLLPTMKDATYDALLQGLNEMKEWYGTNKRMLGEKIMLFDIFLERSDMVSAEDKARLEDTMEEFRSFVGQSRLVRKMVAEAVAETEVKAKGEGLVEGLRSAAVEFVQERFPSLTELAQQAVVEIKEVQQLHRLLRRIYTAPDENAVRWILSVFVA